MKYQIIKNKLISNQEDWSEYINTLKCTDHMQDIILNCIDWSTNSVKSYGLSELVLPSEFTLENTLIKNIEPFAFRMSILPPNFQLPHCIQTIEEGAFYDAKLNLDFTLLNSKVQTIGKIAFYKVVFGPTFSLDNTTISELGSTVFSNAKFDDSFTLKNTKILKIGLGCFKDSVLGSNFTLPECLTSIGSVAFGGVEIKNVAFFENTSITELSEFSASQMTLPPKFKLPHQLSKISSSAFFESIFLGDFEFYQGNIEVGENGFTGAHFSRNLIFKNLHNYNFTKYSFSNIKVDGRIIFSNCIGIVLSVQSFAASESFCFHSYSSTFDQIQDEAFLGFKFIGQKSLWMGIQNIHENALALSSMIGSSVPNFTDLGHGIYKKDDSIKNEWDDYEHLDEKTFVHVLRRRSTKIITRDLYWKYLDTYNEWGIINSNKNHPLFACFITNSSGRLEENNFIKIENGNIYKYMIPKDFKLPPSVKKIPKHAFFLSEVDGIIIEEDVIVSPGAFYSSVLLGEINITNNMLLAEMFSGAEIKCNFIWPKKFKGYAKIPKNFFSNTEIKANLTFPNISYFSENVFLGTKVDGKISFEGKSVRFANSSFSGGDFWGEIHLPLNMKSISECMFYDSKIHKNFVIPNGVEIIQFMAFSESIVSESIELPNSLKIIEANSFDGADLPSSFVLPNSIEKIDIFAFKNCKIGGKLVDSTTELGGGWRYEPVTGESSKLQVLDNKF